VVVKEIEEGEEEDAAGEVGEEGANRARSNELLRKQRLQEVVDKVPGLSVNLRVELLRQEKLRQFLLFQRNHPNHRLSNKDSSLRRQLRPRCRKCPLTALL
jgi:hypothetical protein